MIQNMDQLAQAILAGEKTGHRRALAKAITLIESKLDEHRQQAQALLNTLLQHTGKSLRVGITGIPGVGKSTFIETLGLYLIAQGQKVAVLAVDPSSPLRGGSILGDKTRMEQLSREPKAFIRPTPSEGALGGVAQHTRETLLVCEAAGYDVILVETVGVGQSEYQVAAMVDFFLVLMIPNAGDELQGIKRGIMELADSLVINKTDGESLALAKQTQGYYQSALHLLNTGTTWQPQVLTCSAMENKGIEAVWTTIEDYEQQNKDNGQFAIKRAQQNSQHLDALIQALLTQKFHQNEAVKTQLPDLRQAVIDHEMTAYDAAVALLKLV